MPFRVNPPYAACNVADKKPITDMKETHAFENILSVII